jgi:hypothetical protein
VPTVTAAGVLGMLAGVLACTVESISYYPTTARMCGTTRTNSDFHNSLGSRNYTPFTEPKGSLLFPHGPTTTGNALANPHLHALLS